MKTETAPVRLADYRAPDFAIDTVDLDFRLDPHATRVTARLAMRPTNPGAPLVLDGDELKLVSVAIDGAALAPDRYTATPDRLTVASVPDGPFTLEIVTEIDPTANTKLMGLYRTSGHLVHAVRGRGLPPHHLFPRPAGRARRLHDAHRGGEGRGAGAARQRQPRSRPATSPAPTGTIAVWHDPFPKPSYLFALVAGDLGMLADSFTTMSGREVALAIYCEHGKEERCA